MAKGAAGVQIAGRTPASLVVALRQVGVVLLMGDLTPIATSQRRLQRGQDRHRHGCYFDPHRNTGSFDNFSFSGSDRMDNLLKAHI